MVTCRVEGGGQRAEGGGQRAEGRGQRAEGRGQKLPGNKYQKLSCNTKKNMSACPALFLLPLPPPPLPPPPPPLLLPTPSLETSNQEVGWMNFSIYFYLCGSIHSRFFILAPKKRIHPRIPGNLVSIIFRYICDPQEPHSRNFHIRGYQIEINKWGSLPLPFRQGFGCSPVDVALLAGKAGGISLWSLIYSRPTLVLLFSYPCPTLYPRPTLILPSSLA